MKRLCYLTVLSASALFGDMSQTQPKAKEPPPFDADLYHRDVQCYSLRAEFLYWKIQEAPLDYALKMSSDGWGPEECYAQGHFQNATYNIDPGFRVALTYFRAPHYWEFWTQYTRLTSTGKNHADKPEPAGNYLTGTWPQIFTDAMTKAKSTLHFNYNLADVMISRVFFPNPHLRLRILGGGVGSWMDQFWKVVYYDALGFNTKIANRWSFVGGGLRGGTMFDWYWFSNIYMTGGTSFACLLGSYHNSARQTTNFTPAAVGGVSYTPSLPLRNAHFSDVRPAFQGVFYLGPSYQKNMSQSRVEVFVGYELSAWWNLQEIYRSTAGAPLDAKESWINTGMLALQGLTARVTYDF